MICPICGKDNPNDITRCKICGSSLEVMDSQDKSILQALQHIQGVGSHKAKRIVDSGITSLDKLESADLESFLRVDGIGESTAKDIMEAIEGSKKDEGGLYLCGECGAFVGKSASTCYNCGTKMEDEEDEDTGEDAEIEEFIDDEIKETDEEGSLYLCGNCGSFISDNNITCPYCNAALEDDVDFDDTNDLIDESLIERDETAEVEEEEEESGLYLCENCGSFVSASSDVCTLCGFSFLEDEEKHEKPREELPDDLVDDLIKESEEELKPESIKYEVEDDFSTDDLELDGIELEEEQPTDDLELDGIELEEQPMGELENEQFEIDENWVIDELEVDESDLEELDREIDSALDIEYGITADSTGDVSLGGDIKLCGNCGHLCDEKENICSLCGHEFGDIKELESDSFEETHEEEMSKVTDTMLKALGVKELADVDVTEEEQGVNVCTVCGAFRRENSDRCPICGTLSSEAPDIELSEDIRESRYTEDKLYICDACGAMVTGRQKSCSICGSNLELARREIEEETLGIEEDKNDDIISAFFGDYKGLDIDEKIDDESISFCDVCGALVGQDADNCSICQSSLVEESKDDIKGAEFYFGVDEVTDDDILQIEEEIETELDEDEEEDISELLSQLDQDEDFQDLDSITKLLEEHEDILENEPEIESQLEGAEYIDELVDKELNIDEVEKEEEVTEEEPIDEFEIEDVTEEQQIDEREIIDELVENELQLEDDFTEADIEDDEDLKDILKNISDYKYEQTKTEELEEFDVSAVLDDISHDVKERSEEIRSSKETEHKADEEWMRCPSCESYVDVDSDFCGVCDHSFSDTLEEETAIPSTSEPVKTSQPYAEEIDADWIDDVINEPVKAKVTKKPERYQPPSMIKGNLDRIKEYEVPISGISLLAFGGLSMYSYGEYGLQFLMGVGLVMVGIFMGLGILTLILLRHEYLKDSYQGLLGYSIALIMAAFVPVNICLLSLPLPLIANVGVLGMSLGIFWILDFKIHPKYRYYMLWFFGIILIFIVLSSSLISNMSTYSELGYPIIMSMGLGGVLVFGGTLKWYKQINVDTQAYESIRTGHRHLIMGDYEDALVNLERANMISHKNETETQNKDNSALYSKGLALCSMGEFQKAVEIFKDVLRADPDNVCAWNNLGTAHSRMGNQKKAIMCFKHALNGDPTYEISWNNLGNALYRSGEYSRALDCYDKALELNSSYRDANINKSQALIKLGHSGSRIA